MRFSSKTVFIFVDELVSGIFSFVLFSFSTCFTFKYVCCGGFWRPIFSPTQTERSQNSQFEQSDNKLNYATKPTKIELSPENLNPVQIDLKVASVIN